jgi:hypothetical protein
MDRRTFGKAPICTGVVRCGAWSLGPLKGRNRHQRGVEDLVISNHSKILSQAYTILDIRDSDEIRFGRSEQTKWAPTRIDLLTSYTDQEGPGRCKWTIIIYAARLGKSEGR